MLAQNGVAADIDNVNFKIIKFANAIKNAKKDPGEEAENPTEGTE